MELKEFSHKGEAIEKEIKKEFQFMGRTIKKRRVGLIIAAAGVIAVIAVALFIHSQQFDVWDYITMKVLTDMQNQCLLLIRISCIRSLWVKVPIQINHTMLKC